MVDNSSKDKSLTINDFMLLSVIGKGSYAKVLLVKKKDTEEILALKVLKKEMVEKRKQQEHVQTERDVLVCFPPPLFNSNRSEPTIPSSQNCITLSKMRRNFSSPSNTAPEENFSTYFRKGDTSRRTSTYSLNRMIY